MAEIFLEAASAAPPTPVVAHIDALPPGTRLGEFEIQDLLGVGGFGLVYRAYDTSLQRAVAIKEYMPATLAGRKDGAAVSVRSTGDEGTYHSGLQSFVAEARLLAQFDHPSLVKVYRIWEANNTAYMVMPLYRGMTLGQARSQMTTPPPESWMRAVLWSILQALHVLHRHDTLHRDISPDNIFLQDMGPPVLLDLGAARRAISDKSHKLTAVLKVNYAPIEQYAESAGLKQGPWTDLYSLAAVVYHCLRNDPPLPATTRVVSDDMPSVRSVAQTVKQHFGMGYSDAFVRAIAHALQVKPEDRTQSLAAFVTEMKLKAPPRLNKFDWRSELGPTPHAQGDENHARQFWATQPGALESEAQPARWRVLLGAVFSKASDWRRPLGVGVVLLAIAASLAGVLHGRWLKGSEPVVEAPPPAAMPAPVIAPAEAPPEVTSSSVSAAAGAPSAPVSAEPTPASAASETPKPLARPAVSGGGRAAPAGRKAVAPQATAEANSPPTPTPTPIQNQTQPPVAPKPRAQTPEPEAPALCANANFFARPGCMARECQKPQNAKRQVCIEELQRMRDRDIPKSSDL